MTGRVAHTSLLVLVGIVLLVTPVLSYLYRAPVSITENASTAYTMLPVLWDQDNTWLADNGFMNSTANDTRVQTLGGLNKPWTVADNKTLTAVPVLADSQTNLYFVTGESAASAMDIIVGYGGYITVADDADLELSDNFTLTYVGYIDTSTASGNYTFKEGAFRLWNSGSDNVSASIIVHSHPTAHSDPSADWTTEAAAYDDNVATGSLSSAISGGSWTGYLELSRADTLVSGIRLYTAPTTGTTDVVDVDIYYDSAWHDLFQGTPTFSAWATYLLDAPQSINNTRVRFREDAGAPIQATVRELEYVDLDSVSVSALGVSSGVYSVLVSANTTHMWIAVDDSVEDTVALSGASVIGNSNDWLFMSNATPYADNVSIEVDGVQQLYFAPNAIILDTNLPDREPVGGANNGTITWGSNPTGVNVVLGGMSSSGQSSIGATGGTDTSDLLPVVGGTNWDAVPEVSGALLTNPLRPIVTAISDNTTLSERQVWVWLGIIFVVFITILVGANVRGHHLITGIASSAAILLLIVWTVFPLLSLIVIILVILGGIVSERTHSL